MNLDDLVAIESTPDRSICEYEAQDGYTVYRASLFPTYYSGNGLALEQGGRSLAEWEAMHARHFPVDSYEHRTFTFDDRAEFAPLVAAAKAHHYHCAYEHFLHLARAPAAVPPPPEGLVLRQVRTEAEWKEMQRFDDEQNSDEDWYEEGESALFEKDRFVSQAVGICWDYLADAETGRMRAKVGSFTRDGVVSLQDVMTDRTMRRQGLATGLLHMVIERYRGEGMDHFSLSADRDEEAIRIYRRLGFRDVGSKIVMMTYPGIEID
jgi:GNAT superfamily N-acetyltransferase